MHNTDIPSSNKMTYRIEAALVVFTLLPSFILCGNACLSCSGVDGATSCQGVAMCADNEVCFMHKYRTESNKEFYDFGCSYKEVCLHFYPGANSPGLGKRQINEGHHLMCLGCCNDTSLCNMRLPCDDPGSRPTPSESLPRSCEDLTAATTSGVYTIYPDGTQAVQVYCEILNGEKWTVIQRRIDGSVNFYRNWMDYKIGFGSANGEYWLGLDQIHRISTARSHQLAIFLEDFDNVVKYANYSSFMLGDEFNRYPIFVSGFNGSTDCGDSLEYHNNQAFSTFDNDIMNHGCPQARTGGWWYVHCSYSNLNGPYTGGQGTDGNTMTWYHWRKYYSLKQTKMMIKSV